MNRFFFFLAMAFSMSCSTAEISVCDCKKSLYGDDATYRKCLMQDFDAAFDYWERTDPNMKFANQEAVIQAYWMENCSH